MQISDHKTRTVFDRYNIVSPKNIADAGKQLVAFLRDNSGTIPHSVPEQEAVKH
jgi:hypothetical protein